MKLIGQRCWDPVKNWCRINRHISYLSMITYDHICLCIQYDIHIWSHVNMACTAYTYTLHRFCMVLLFISINAIKCLDWSHRTRWMVGDSGRRAPQMERLDRSSPSKKQLGGSLMIDAQNPSGYGNYLMIISHVSRVYTVLYIHTIMIYIYIYTYTVHTFSHNVSSIRNHLHCWLSINLIIARSTRITLRVATWSSGDSGIWGEDLQSNM